MRITNIKDNIVGFISSDVVLHKMVDGIGKLKIVAETKCKTIFDIARGLTFDEAEMVIKNVRAAITSGREEVTICPIPA